MRADGGEAVAVKVARPFAVLQTDNRGRKIATSGAVPLPAPDTVVGPLLASLVDGLFLAWLADPEGTDVDAVLRLLDDMLQGIRGAPVRP